MKRLALVDDSNYSSIRVKAKAPKTHPYGDAEGMYRYLDQALKEPPVSVALRWINERCLTVADLRLANFVLSETLAFRRAYASISLQQFIKGVGMKPGLFSRKKVLASLGLLQECGTLRAEPGRPTGNPRGGRPVKVWRLTFVDEVLSTEVVDETPSGSEVLSTNLVDETVSNVTLHAFRSEVLSTKTGEVLSTKTGEVSSTNLVDAFPKTLRIPTSSTGNKNEDGAAIPYWDVERAKKDQEYAALVAEIAQLEQFLFTAEDVELLRQKKANLQRTVAVVGSEVLTR